MFSLRGNYDFCTCLREHYLQVIIIGASLYNICTRLRSQRTTSSSSKCREKIRWRLPFLLTIDMRINKTKITGNMVAI